MESKISKFTLPIFAIVLMLSMAFLGFLFRYNYLKSELELENTKNDYLIEEVDGVKGLNITKDKLVIELQELKKSVIYHQTQVGIKTDKIELLRIEISELLSTIDKKQKNQENVEEDLINLKLLYEQLQDEKVEGVVAFNNLVELTQNNNSEKLEALEQNRDSLTKQIPLLQSKLSQILNCNE